jgi:2-polyprenyl-3-methyl-5-hydroxy-6-metoxy-1,4-benzoquinol methylase
MKAREVLGTWLRHGMGLDEGQSIIALGASVLNSGRMHLHRANRKLAHMGLLHIAPIETGFFDLYPCFYSTSVTGTAPNRLNQRHRALIAPNEAIIRGKSVLDIASHDGRWSFAAHKAGARYVLGIEARDHLVKSAELNMREYGVQEDRVRFVRGDVFEEFDRLESNTFETIFCFGFLYHTMHHMLLLSQIARLNPEHIILDTTIDLNRHNIIRVKTEKFSDENNAAVGAPGDPVHAVVGHPSRGALDSTCIQPPEDTGGKWHGLGCSRRGRRVNAREFWMEFHLLQLASGWHKAMGQSGRLS